MRPWSKLPSYWYRYPPGLAALRAGATSSESECALRLLIALATLTGGKDFRVLASLTDLEGLTGLSRTLVIRGVRAGLQFGFFARKVGDPKNPSEYVLSKPAEDGGPNGGWAKIPNRPAVDFVPSIPHGAGGLAALKVYLTLLAARGKLGHEVKLTHVKIREKTGIQANRIRQALSVLANEGLIVIDDPNPRAPEYVSRTYRLVGRFDTLEPSSTSEAATGASAEGA